MGTNDAAIHGTRPLHQTVARASEDPWVRWTSRPGVAYAIVHAAGPVELQASPQALAIDTAQLLDRTPIPAQATGDRILAHLPDAATSGPVVVRFAREG